MVKKIFVIAILVVILFGVGSGCFALEISSASLVSIGQADYHLQYYKSSSGTYTYVICAIVGYYMNDTFYPAYCLNNDRTGVSSSLSYSVDINSVIDNDAVWRVVTNGYPYKTASQMGLENDFDAYIVTKMAIYCVLGQSNLDYFKASSSDSTAVQMLSVLQNLVDIGLNGTETRQTGTMTASTVGDLVSSGDYYYQEYSVSSTVNMSSYSVSTSGFSSETYIANTSNEATTTFSAGENFRIFIPKSSLNEDINGTIDITGSCETYPLFYGESGSSDLQDYLITYSTYGDETISTNLNISTNTGSLKILKLEEGTETPLEGIEFSLTSEDGNTSYTKTTDENGEITFDGLYQGTYILTETSTTENYILSESNWYVDIVYNEITSLTIENSVKTGKIKITKIDSETGSPLAGVTFNIVDSDTGEIIETLVTDENGEAESSELRIDKNYYLQEIATIDGYILNDELYYFNVEYNETLEITIENEQILVEEDSTEEVIQEEKILPQTGF